MVLYLCVGVFFLYYHAYHRIIHIVSLGWSSNIMNLNFSFFYQGPNFKWMRTKKNEMICNVSAYFGCSLSAKEEQWMWQSCWFDPFKCFVLWMTWFIVTHGDRHIKFCLNSLHSYEFKKKTIEYLKYFNEIGQWLSTSWGRNT